MRRNQLPILRAICINTASLVAQANIGRGMTSWGHPVSAQVRKAMLWAIAWCEGEVITHTRLGAIAGMKRDAAVCAVYSLAADELITIHEGRKCQPNRYTLNREKLTQLVVPTHFGTDHSKKDKRASYRRKKVAACP